MTKATRRVRIAQAAKRLGLDWFILALLGMIGLAYLWPAPGAQQGRWSLSTLATYGVSVIFFFYGLKLPFRELLTSLSNWRLHVVVQAATFLVFPLLVWGVLTVLGQEESQGLWAGIFFLAALPSTVSSSVVMVSIAHGNVPAAIFNASISSLLGVFITPLWMRLVMSSGTGAMEATPVVQKLMIQVLLPVVLGMLLNPVLHTLAARYRQTLKYFDQVIILLIVYTSFCDSFAQRMFAGYQVVDLLALGAGLIVLFGIIYLLTSSVGRLLQFSQADQITLTFCGSKKSLVHGSVMVSILFSSSIAGVVLLPVMIYHALQLIAVSVIAQAKARRVTASHP